jgi:hypothetical protein
MEQRSVPNLVNLGQTVRKPEFRNISQLTLYASNIPSAVCATPPEDHCNRGTANWHYMQTMYRVRFVQHLLRIAAIVAQPTDIIRKQYTECVLCSSSWVSLQSWHSQLTLYARNIPSAVCLAPPEDEQVMLETCRCPWFSINWMKCASRWFHYTDILWCTFSKTLSLIFMLPIMNFVHWNPTLSINQ